MKVFRVFMALLIIMTMFCGISKASAASFYPKIPKHLRLFVSRNNPDILQFSIPAAPDQKVQLLVVNGSGILISSEERAASALQIDIKTLKSDGMYTFTVIAAGQQYDAKALVMPGR